MKSKAILTAHFLERKAVECAMLKSELEEHQKHMKRLEPGEAKKKLEEAT